MFQNLKRKWFGEKDADAKRPPSKIREDGNNEDNLDTDSSSSSSKVQEESGSKSVGVQVDLKNGDEGELNLQKAEFTSLHDAVVSNISCFKCGRLPRSLPITSCPGHCSYLPQS